jgi:hypothetical protein
MLTAVLTYFGLVLGAGFVLGIVRTRWLVPPVRERHAELLETPVMLIVVWMGARFIVGRLNGWAVVCRLGTGTLALLLLLLAEWGVVRFLRQQSIDESIANRDPVSGAAYLLALVLFAVAPSRVGDKGGRPTG